MSAVTESRPAAAPRGRRVPRPGPALGALLLYAGLSLLLFGLPVLPHPERMLIAKDQYDSSLFVWLYAWWPYALGHGLNPLVTHLMFVPEGFNLQWTTSMPAPSLLLAPLTLAFSPELSWNVIQLACPALSAWAMFALARELTGLVAPALVAGYAYGFSAYELLHLTGSPFAALVALPCLFVWLAVRRLRGVLSARRYTLAMAAALTAQFLVSTEVLVACLLFGALALAVAALLLAPQRRALAGLAGRTACAGAIAAVLLSPFLLEFFLGRHYPPVGTFFSADLVSLVKPPYFVALAGEHTPGGLLGASPEGYLGLPLLAVVALWLWAEGRRRAVWVPAVVLGLALLLSLGRTLRVGGHDTGLPLPWRLFDGLPVLRYAIPVRFALFAILSAALILGLWLARGRWWRWALAGLVLASFAPDAGNPAWRIQVSDPPFFSRGLYRDYLSADDAVLTVPALGANERWQADTRFAFRLAAGYAGAFPGSYSRYPTWTTLQTGVLGPGYGPQLRRFVADHGVTAVIVDPRIPGPWRTLFAALGVQPRTVGGVLLYRLRNLSASSGRSTSR